MSHFTDWNEAKAEDHNRKVAASKQRFLERMGSSQPMVQPVIVQPGTPTVGYANFIPAEQPKTEMPNYSVSPFKDAPIRFDPESYRKDVLKIIINVEPMGAVRCNRSVRWKKTERQERYFAYKDQVRAAAEKAAKESPVPVPDKLRITAFIAMPDSWSNKKRSEMTGMPHRQRPDADNILKGVKDAIWQEDGAIWNESCKKFWCRKGDARLELELTYYRSK